MSAARQWTERVADRAPPPLGDLRFTALLAPGDWAALPRRTRRRFSQAIPPGACRLYAGRVSETWHSRIGWLLAQALRVIGAPLPLPSTGPSAASVAVSDDPSVGGQIWTRIYHRSGRFPQVVHSVKRFAGPTGLEEYVGRGIGMALTLSVEDQTLVFDSAFYFFQLGSRRVPIPRVLSPGALRVTHREDPDGGFVYSLSLRHPILGKLVRQEACFTDAG